MNEQGRETGSNPLGDSLSVIQTGLVPFAHYEKVGFFFCRKDRTAFAKSG